jgi:glycosyltransferase involved in cell wall biosynthesis
MGVHNAAGELAATLDSVLGQAGVDFELIVVDDGSTDQTYSVLESYAKNDRRLRILSIPLNQGLTEALIAGCQAARGVYIARQDSGDRSLPGRLAGQVAWLEAHPNAVFASCHTQFIGLFGEPLYELRISAAELNETLTVGVDGDFRGPSHHGSVMMRASAYRRTGGYRQPFVVAQDLDLWLRLVELGEVGVVETIGYESHVSPTGISAQKNGLQTQLAKLAGELARVRRNGGDEAESLAAFTLPILGPVRSANALLQRHRYAAYTYFLGRCTTATNPTGARRYFLAGLARCPWHLRSWYGLAASAFR